MSLGRSWKGILGVGACSEGDSSTTDVRIGSGGSESPWISSSLAILMGLMQFDLWDRAVSSWTTQGYWIWALVTFLDRISMPVIVNGVLEMNFSMSG